MDNLEHRDPGCARDRASCTVAGHDNVGADRQRLAVKCHDRSHLNIGLALRDVQDLDPEANLTALRDQRIGPVGYQLMLRVDVVTLTIIGVEP